MRQLFFSVVVIVVVGSLAAVGTYAGFIDTETSSENLFQAGTLELVLENPAGIGESEGHSVLRTWHYENRTPPGLMEPGDVLSSQVTLIGFDTGEGDHVDVRCIIVNSEPDWDVDIENEAEDAILGYDVPPDPGFGVFDKDIVMIITSMTYGATTIVSGEYAWDPAYFTDTSGDGRISLDEFEAQGLSGLTPAPDSSGIIFAMTVKFADGTWNEYQGDHTMMTLIFLLEQQ